MSPLYFLRNYGVLLAVSVVCCTPLIEKLWDVLRKNVVDVYKRQPQSRSRSTAALLGRRPDGRGDMYVKCEVEIPKKLNKAQR